MNGEPTFPLASFHRWRIHSAGIIALGFGLAGLALGCSSSEEPQPAIAGKAHAFRSVFLGGAEFLQRFTMDTGRTGNLPRTSDDVWEADCNVSESGSPWMSLKYLPSLAGDLPGEVHSIFDRIFLRAYPDPSQEISIKAGMDSSFLFTGTCKVVFEKTNGDSAEGTFSTPACDIDDMDEYHGRLEFAEFHVTSCNTEPVEPPDD